MILVGAAVMMSLLVGAAVMVVSDGDGSTVSGGGDAGDIVAGARVANGAGVGRFE